MMKIGRCAGLTAVMAVTIGAVLMAGCGGGDGGATTGSISGTIVYAPNGQPLGGISVSAGGRTTTSRSDGTFLLKKVPAGAQTLTVEADPNRGLAVPPGADLSVTVQAGQTVDLGSAIVLIDVADLPPSPPS
ncbi:MAG: carboxypeptidase regulatory-like domain-containing protein [Armatimonadota bacterium]